MHLSETRVEEVNRELVSAQLVITGLKKDLERSDFQAAGTFKQHGSIESNNDGSTQLKLLGRTSKRDNHRQLKAVRSGRSPGRHRSARLPSARNDLAIICWNVRVPARPVHECPYAAYNTRSTTQLQQHIMETNTFATTTRWQLLGQRSMDRAADPKHAEGMVVGAVVTCCLEPFTERFGDVAGEIISVAHCTHEDEVKTGANSAGTQCMVRFPEYTGPFAPGSLMLATSEQAEQWAATKLEREARDAAHAEPLVVGAVVTLTKATIGNSDIPEGTVGEIVETTDDVHCTPADYQKTCPFSHWSKVVSTGATSTCTQLTL
jgi:hypothetical protein